MDLDAIFDTSPRDKFFDIILNANRSVVEVEIDRLITELAALREIAEAQNINEAQIAAFMAQNADKMEMAINDAYIEFGGAILSKNE